MAMHYLSYIPTFVKVVERQSFSGAARDLGMTKSAVSKHIQSLEEGLRVRLLNRTTRTLSLTEEGQIFYAKCTHIVEELESAEQLVHNLNENPSGVLKINAPTSFGALHLAPLIAEFGALYPDIRLEVDFSDHFIDIIAEGVDVCIRVASLTDSSLIAKKLSGCPIIMAASPDYIAQHGAPTHPDQLINHRFIEYSYIERLREWRYRDPADGREKVAPITVTMRANNAQMMRQAALAGVGILNVPSFIIADDVKQGRLVRLLGEYLNAPERNIYALFPHNRFMSAKVRLFIDFIATRLTQVDWESDQVMKK
jgi:DNA-binding transcriptional LysR family regulator